MIGQNKFICLVRINSFVDYSMNHFELIDTESINSMLSLVENCNIVGATPIENYKYYTASASSIVKIPVGFIAENKQFILFINKQVVNDLRYYELYNAVDSYLTYRLNQFWLSSKTNIFKNISYPGYIYDPLSFVDP